MPELSAKKRASLPNGAFAYVDSKGRRRLPINDEAHVRNALARFNRIAFEDDGARERARQKLLRAARKYGIDPLGFITGQLRSQQREAVAGRLVTELGGVGGSVELERRLRTVLGDPTLQVLRWSDSNQSYLDDEGQRAELPVEDDGRAVTLLERDGRPMTALVHGTATLDDPELVRGVSAAVRLAVENDRLLGQVGAQAGDVSSLPSGFVTFLLSDIEGSTALLDRLGDGYAGILADVRSLLRAAVREAGGREVDARADEYFAVFDRPAAALEGALAIQRRLGSRAWPGREDVRLRIGIHSGRPTLTDSGYVGLAVNTAARLTFAGHGGQILISGAARDPIAATQPPGVEFRELGVHRFRGLREPVAVFQVLASDLIADFPALRAGDASER
jgi:class 3 adenylate cyclase